MLAVDYCMSFEELNCFSYVILSLLFFTPIKLVTYVLQLIIYHFFNYFYRHVHLKLESAQNKLKVSDNRVNLYSQLHVTIIAGAIATRPYTYSLILLTSWKGQHAVIKYSHMVTKSCKNLA